MSDMKPQITNQVISENTKKDNEKQRENLYLVILLSILGKSIKKTAAWKKPEVKNNVSLEEKG